MVVASYIFAVVFQIGQEKFIIECFEGWQKRMVLVIQIWNSFYNETIISLGKLIHKDIYSLDTGDYKIVIDTAFDSTVEIEQSYKLPHLCCDQILRCTF